MGESSKCAMEVDGSGSSGMSKPLNTQNAVYTAEICNCVQHVETLIFHLTISRRR